MRIVLINDWFSEVMGYSENYLSKALAELGHDVHLVTSDAKPYFDSPDYESVYQPFLGPGVVEPGHSVVDGFHVHRLRHGWMRGRLRLSGLTHLLHDLRPDVVQSFETFALSTVEAAYASLRSPFRLFLESHIHASVFLPPNARDATRPSRRWTLYRHSVGAFVNSRTMRCYPISQDAAEIAINWFGISPAKVRVTSLGVDTERFRPGSSNEEAIARRDLRASLGLSEDDIVCIYTGRLTAAKGPQILANAVAHLVESGEPYRALFVGSGAKAEVAALSQAPGSAVHPFVPADELARLYRAADIGVWPRQESTSQLDAAASGLPIVITDQAHVRERIDGNGFTYSEGNATDLARVLLMLRTPARRASLGDVGARRMRERFSWSAIARDRADDFASALT